MAPKGNTWRRLVWAALFAAVLIFAASYWTGDLPSLTTSQTGLPSFSDSIKKSFDGWGGWAKRELPP